MKNYTITEEQIKKNKDLTLKEYFKELFSLEVGKWYKYEDRDVSWLMNYQLDGNLCYGFNTLKLYGNKYSMDDYIEWEIATPEEVETVLITEAKKRGLTPENLKRIKCVRGWSESEGQSYFEKLGCFSFDFYSNSLWIKKGSYLSICIFDNGKWAELKEETQPKETIELDGHTYKLVK